METNKNIIFLLYLVTTFIYITSLFISSDFLGKLSIADKFSYGLGLSIQILFGLIGILFLTVLAGAYNGK